QSRQCSIQGHIEILRRGGFSSPSAGPADQAIRGPRDIEAVRAIRLVEHIGYTLQGEQQAGEAGLIMGRLRYQTQRYQSVQGSDRMDRRLARRDRRPLDRSA